MDAQGIPFEAVIDVLKKVEIFKSLPNPIIEELGKKVIFCNFQPDTNIIKQGEKGSSMYVIFSGEVKVHDMEFTITTLNSGNFFGEFSLLDDEPRSLSVSTITISDIGNIKQEDFYAVLNKHPEITRDIIKVMLKRLRNQNQQIINQLREKQKELEELVRLRTNDLRLKNEDLENTLNELKRTQEQLVQQAKLASLGQITAGIAHEIQNPLNFINNFSSISKELADEITSATSSEEQLEIISDLKINLSKIEDHGKRADRIVKGMLMHSKSSKGEKQNTDIHALCEQSLNLAYNSISTNFPNLNCNIKKKIANDIPRLNVIPHDLARVLINIFNNAFYALNQKLKIEKMTFLPEIEIEIKNNNKSVYISIYDNGIGIPDSDKDKIFQPFFTTKPTGQGTGLGLSTGYEIVKAHGGEIQFKSKQNEFTEMTICLPV